MVATLACPEGCSLAADDIRRGLNTRLPEDVAVVEAAWAPEGFDPRGDAVSRTYEYVLRTGTRPVLDRHTAWHVGAGALDVARMREAAEGFEEAGPIDYASYAAATKGPGARSNVCRISSLRVTRTSNTVVVRITADRFLYRMCRRLVGVLVAVGRGQLDLDALVASPSDRPECTTAPAAGLRLVRCEYVRACGDDNDNPDDAWLFGEG
jgi:tRNA pseudouridine38-40 synthase